MMPANLEQRIPSFVITTAQTALVFYNRLFVKHISELINFNMVYIFIV